MRTPLILLIAAAALTAQSALSVTTTPDPVSSGGIVTLTFTASGGVVNLNGSSGYSGVRLGTPTGPFTPGCCITLPVIVPIAPCQSYTSTWQAPFVLQPAQFWFEVQWYDATWNPKTSYFAVNVDSYAATITQLTSPARGTWWTCALSATASAGMPYAAVASLTTDTGILAPSIGFIGLDNDLLFQLTLANTLPGYSMNLQGVLNLTGTSPPISLFIPQIAQLACVAVHMQAAVLTPVGTLVLSQVHDGSIL